MPERPHRGRGAGLATRVGRWVAARSRARWLPVVLPIFPAADFVAPVMPNQLLLAGLSALNPRRWAIFAMVFAIGTALGALGVASAIELAGARLSLFVDTASEGGEIARLLARLREWGLVYLAAISLLPWTPRLSVVACALLGFAPLAIAGTVLASRVVPSSALALTGAHGPKLLARFPFMRRIIPQRLVQAGEAIES